MDHKLERFDDVGSTCGAAADALEDVIASAIAARGRSAVAVSGGRTPAMMFAALATRPLDWERVEIFQVDERVAPAGDPARNLTSLSTAFEPVRARIVPMPVTDPDLEAAATSYGQALPERFDAIHLGIGADGHTASLVPGDPVLDVMDRPVALTEPYQGRRRMTLTYLALDRTDLVVWLVAGAEKRDALRQLLAGDQSIPAGRVDAATSLVFADGEAA
jgi:6-phosphogluconolactonase